MNSYEARILALVVRSKAVSAEVSRLKAQDATLVALGEAPINQPEDYRDCVFQLHQIADNIENIARSGELERN